MSDVRIWQVQADGVMLAMKFTLLFLSVLFVGCTRPISRDDNSVKSGTVLDVTAKQLLEEPNKYSGKIVRVSGYWIRGFEWSNFSAARDDHTSDIWVDHFLSPPSNPIEVQLKEAYVAAEMEWPRMNIRVLITCEGLFEHRDFEFDETKIGPGFGHLGHYHSQLSISKIIDIKAMTDLEYASPR